jgi:hypothetical protein
LISYVPDDKAGTEPFFPLIRVQGILRAAQFPIRAPMQRLSPNIFSSHHCL